MKRLISISAILLCLLIALTTGIFAAEPASGTCGESLTWSLTDGVLTISGTGDMDDWGFVPSDLDPNISVMKQTPWSGSLTDIREIVIESGVTGIGNLAFSGCQSLETLILPDTLTRVGTAAFSDCTQLRAAEFSSGLLTIGDSAFYQCTSLGKVSLPDSITSIGTNAFSGCANMTGATIPANLNKLGAGAFSGCKMLLSVTIPNTLAEIPAEAFSGCSGIRYLSVGTGVQSIGDKAFFNCTGFQYLTLYSGLKTIGNSAFSGCYELSKIWLPGTLESVGKYAFMNCPSLEAVYYEGTQAQWSGVTLGEMHSLPTALLQTDTAPQQVPGGLCGDNLTWILVDNVLTISGTGKMYDFETEGGSSTPWFRYAREVTTVTVDMGVTSIGDGAFISFRALEQVSLPHGLASIGDMAFIYCAKLQDLTLPGTVTAIGERAFSGCELVETIVIPQGVPAIGNGTFQNCLALKTITIPDSVQSIGISAFSGCESLREITIPQGVTAIEHHAFQGCSALTRVELPDTVLTIGEMAFDRCTALESITLSKNLTSIGAYAFSKCDSLHQLEIPASVTQIGEMAYGYTYKYPDYSNTHDYVRMDKVEIVGYPASAAQDYATENQIPFIDINLIPGYVFDDVAEGRFYYDPVIWAVDNEITAGITNTTFEPETLCTRGQVVTFLWRAAGCPEPESTENPFVDVEQGRFYYKAVLWAVENDITAGVTPTKFCPNDTCTRGQVVTFLWRFANEPVGPTMENPFEDVEDGRFYNHAVRWAVDFNITKGITATRFEPEGECTRGQVVTFLYRLAML